MAVSLITIFALSHLPQDNYMPVMSALLPALSNVVSIMSNDLTATRRSARAHLFSATASVHLLLSFW